MIGLDTNVLVRLIIDDDTAQAAAVERLVADAIASGEPLFVSDAVVCELVWVLGRVYQFTRAELLHTLRSLLQSREILWNRKEELRRAVDDFATGKGDFSDYLIRALAIVAGCDRVATFDKALIGETSYVGP